MILYTFDAPIRRNVLSPCQLLQLVLLTSDINDDLILNSFGLFFETAEVVFG